MATTMTRIGTGATTKRVLVVALSALAMTALGQGAARSQATRATQESPAAAPAATTQAPAPSPQERTYTRSQLTKAIADARWH